MRYRVKEYMQNVLTNQLEQNTYRRIVEWFSNQKIVILGVTVKLVVNGVVEYLLHTIPILNNAMLNRILGKIVAVVKRISTHAIVQVF